MQEIFTDRGLFLVSGQIFTVTSRSGNIVCMRRMAVTIFAKMRLIDGREDIAWLASGTERSWTPPNSLGRKPRWMSFISTKNTWPHAGTSVRRLSNGGGFAGGLAAVGTACTTPSRVGVLGPTGAEQERLKKKVGTDATMTASSSAAGCVCGYLCWERAGLLYAMYVTTPNPDWLSLSKQ